MNHKDRWFPDSLTLHFEFEVWLRPSTLLCVPWLLSQEIQLTRAYLHAWLSSHSIDFTRFYLSSDGTPEFDIRKRGMRFIQLVMMSVVRGVCLLGLWVSPWAQFSQSFYLKELNHRVA